VSEHSTRLAEIESRSIEYVPDDERHGRVIDQGPFWFLSNFHFFAIAIGFVGPSLGLTLGYTALAGTLGILLGTTFQAFHASQGAELGLPQMIQSRAQFGGRGVIVPLLGVLISLLGYNVVATVLLAEGLHQLWALNGTLSAVGVSVLAAALAIWGHDWLHRVFRLLFWISLPLFSVLSLAIIAGKAGGHVSMLGGFGWPAFLTQLASAASFNVTAAPYVSDYSRYLPRRTPRHQIILNVFAGSALSAIWLIALGAWLATRMGVTDGLIALQLSGDMLWQGLGSLLAATSIAALIATIGMNAYSAMLTVITSADSLRPVRPTRAWRIVVIVASTAVWILIAVRFGNDAVTLVNSMLIIMLYFLMPWTAVNLIDYFFLRRGRYSIRDLCMPDGIYGAWAGRGLWAYAIGFAASIPFFVVPNFYTGPLAQRLGGIDVGWIVGLLAASAAYLTLSRNFDLAKEAAAVQLSETAFAAPAKPR
jgi:nucleobase:cation symporter-1, NCS1 family